MRCRTCEHDEHPPKDCDGVVLVARSYNGHPYETYVSCTCPLEQIKPEG